MAIGSLQEVRGVPMSDKLRDAIDEIQGYVDDGEPVPIYCSEELQAVLEAAWRYWDLQDEEYDGS